MKLVISVRVSGIRRYTVELPDEEGWSYLSGKKELEPDRYFELTECVVPDDIDLEEEDFDINEVDDCEVYD